MASYSNGYGIGRPYRYNNVAISGSPGNYSFGRPYRYNNLAISGSPSCTLSNKPFTTDLIYGGNGTLSGFCRINGSPPRLVSRKIRLYEHRTMNLVREIWSNSDGSWSMTYLDTGKFYILIAYDPDYTQPGIIDLIVPT